MLINIHICTSRGRGEGREQEEEREELFHFLPKYSVLRNEMMQLTTVRRTAQDRK